MVALAKRSADPELLAEADHFAGMLSFHLGQFQSSRDRLEKLAEGGEYRGRYHSEVYGIDTRVLCRGYISHCDWHLGYPIRGLKIAEEGLALAREISHPFSIAIALNYLAMLHQFRRDADAALKAAVEARNICAEYRFDYYGAWSKLIRAWAIAESGNLDEGLADYDAALEEFRRTSAGLRISHHLGLLAALHGKAGRALTGLRLIDEAYRYRERRTARHGAMPNFTGSAVICCCWPLVMTLKLRPTRSSRLRLKLRRPRERNCPSFAPASHAPDSWWHAARGGKRATL